MLGPVRLPKWQRHMKKIINRLALNRQTIRTLASPELRLANGGVAAGTGTNLNCVSYDLLCETYDCSSGLPCTNSTIGCGP